jgi:hypothetical protein
MYLLIMCTTANVHWRPDFKVSAMLSSVEKNRKIKHACHPVVVDDIAGKKITFIG